MRILLVAVIAIFLAGCSAGKSTFSSEKKYSLQQVEKDYSIYETMLEGSHPGLYWYNSKDSMKYYFKLGAAQLRDSMDEPEFKKLLTWVTAKVDCGHTSVRFSKKYSKFLDTLRSGIFPLSMKVWAGRSRKDDDTMAVTSNLIRRDTVFKRGTRIKSINGKPVRELLDTMFQYISSDGYNRTHKFQTLSNRGYFGNLYTSLYGLSNTYSIEYFDDAGNAHMGMLPVFNSLTDTFNRAAFRLIARTPQPSRKERKQREIGSVRMLKIDSVNHTAFMDLNSFGRGYHLKDFFHKSFKELHDNQVKDLIIDVRSNGGGSVTNSTLLSRYIIDHTFRFADSLYAIRKKDPYNKYIQNDFFNRLFMTFMTRKKKDGFYHFGYFERHHFHPKHSNHFEGNVYVLVGGNSFSATTLFTSSIIRQDNVIVVGEETGGGAYGNTAWLIPDVTLPETGVRFRLPLFRLVIDKNYPKNGMGVQPKVEAKPTLEAVRRGADFKLDKVMELIRQEREAKPVGNAQN